MKKTISFFLMILISSHFYSQKAFSKDYVYSVSKPYKEFEADAKMFLEKDNEILAVKADRKNNILIQKFSAGKPELIQEKRYDVGFLPKNFYFENIVETNGRFYFYFSSWDGGNVENEQLFSIEIDFAKGEFIGTPKLLFKIHGKLAQKENPVFLSYFQMPSVFQMVGTYRLRKFEFFRSNDNKNLLIKYRKKPLEKKDTKNFDVIGLCTYDENMKQTFSHEFTMPYTERRMNNLDFQVDNKGNLYMLTKIFHDDSNDDRKRSSDTEANYHIELFTIKNGSDKIQITKFDNKDKFINKIWMFDTNKDYMVFGGFYSNAKGYYGNCDGIVTFKTKSDGNIYDKSFHEIPLEILNQYESANTVRKNEKQERNGENPQFSDLVLKDFQINNDGSMVFVGEQQYTVNYNTMKHSSTHSYYCNLLVSKVNADGTLAWMRKIPKYQTGLGGRGGMSYKFFSDENNYFVVFLDNIKNLNLPVNKEPAKHTDGQGGYLTAVKISDADGTVKKSSILDAREVEDFQVYKFFTSNVIKTDDGGFVFEADKKKDENIMIKVSLKLK